MNYNIDWQRDFRDGLKEETILRLYPLENYPKGNEVEFTIIRESGRGGSVITYEALCQNNGIAERCFLKELYPEHICESENLFRTSDGISLAVSHGFDEAPSIKENFSLINSEVWKSFNQDYQNIKKIRLNVGNAPLFICDADEIYRNNSTYYIKVPFETNKTLEKHIEETDIKNKDLMRILALGKELAIMTGKLHNEGYLHLDIKPENLLYKSIDNKAAETLSFLDLGTVVRTEDIKKGTIKYLPSSHGYSSPEQEFRHTVDLTCPETTDIFSIGAVVFKMLTGRKPTEADCRKKEFVFDKTDPLFKKYDQTLFEKLNILLCKTLSISPSLRFQSCKEVEEHIQNVIDSPDKPFDRAINRMHPIFSKKTNNSKNLFCWKDEEFEKDLFPCVSDAENKKHYDSLSKLICDKTNKKRIFWLGGQGGRGKTAHLKRLVYDLCHAPQKFFAPIYINSQKISDIIKSDSKYTNTELKKAICDELGINSTPKELDSKISLLEEYQFAVIVDGLNEIDEDQKYSILSQIDDLTKSLSKCVFIVSDRGTSGLDKSKHTSVIIHQLSEEIVRPQLNDKNNSKKLIDLLSGNIYLFKKFRKTKDKDRVFENQADILTSYYEDILASITKEVEAKNKTVDKKKLVESLAKLAFSSCQIATLRVDEDSLSYSFKDTDYINAIRSKQLFVHQDDKDIVFEHELIRDFIVAYALAESVKLCCRNNSSQAISELLSKNLPDDVLRFLGELLKENRLFGYETQQQLADYDNYCRWLSSTGFFFELFGPLKFQSRAYKWDDTQLEYTLTYFLNLIKNEDAKETTLLKFNIIRSIVLGRGYHTLEKLLSAQAPAFKKQKNTTFNRIKKHAKEENSGFQRLLFNVRTDAQSIDVFSSNHKDVPYSKYVGSGAFKKRKIKIASTTIMSLLFLTVISSLVYNRVVQHIEIESTNPVIDGIWAAESTQFNTGFKVFSKDYNPDTPDTVLTPRHLTAEDFITEGFRADISLEFANNTVSVAVSNVVPLNGGYEATECRLILKKGVISTNNGILSRENKEVEICRFNVFPDKNYEIITSVNFDNTYVKKGDDLAFSFNFTSSKPFESNISNENFILENFSADVDMSLEKQENKSDNIFSHFYHVTLSNIQPTGEGEKRIHVLEGAAKNKYGVSSYSENSCSFEIVDNLEYLSAPEINCELFSDKTVSPGASLLFVVEFYVDGPESYNGKFTSEFTVASFEAVGFTYKSVHIADISSDTHTYWVLLSNVEPAADAKEYGISIYERTAITQNGTANEKKTFVFDIPFVDTVSDSTAPTIHITSAFNNEPERYFNNENLFFIINVEDNSILPNNDINQIKNSIRLLNATYNDIIIVENGSDNQNHRSYWVKITNVSPVSVYQNVKLQILPGAVNDAFGNISEDLLSNIFTEESLKYYCDYKRGFYNSEMLDFSEDSIEICYGKTQQPISLSVNSLLSFNYDDLYMDGFEANITILRTPNSTISIELTNVQFDEGVDSGTLTLYAISENRTVYQTSILVKQQ